MTAPAKSTNNSMGLSQSAAMSPPPQTTTEPPDSTPSNFRINQVVYVFYNDTPFPVQLTRLPRQVSHVGSIALDHRTRETGSNRTYTQIWRGSYPGHGELPLHLQSNFIFNAPGGHGRVILVFRTDVYDSELVITARVGLVNGTAGELRSDMIVWRGHWIELEMNEISVLRRFTTVVGPDINAASPHERRKFVIGGRLVRSDEPDTISIQFAMQSKQSGMARTGPLWQPDVWYSLEDEPELFREGDDEQVAPKAGGSEQAQVTMPNEAS